MNWLASASTCEKSGLMVPLSVRFGVTPQRTLPPASGRLVSYCHVDPDGVPSECAVTTGLRSSTRPRRRSVRPSRVPDCARKELFARSAGVQLFSCPRLCTRRMMLSAHDCT